MKPTPFKAKIKALLHEFSGFFPHRTAQFLQDDPNHCMVEISDSDDGLMTYLQNTESGLCFYVINHDGKYTLQIQTLVMNGELKGNGLAKDMVETLLEFFGDDLEAVNITDESHGWWEHFAEAHPTYHLNLDY